MDQQSLAHDGERGRTDPPQQLRDRLSTAPPSYAEGALLNPHIDPALVEVMLENPALPGSILAQVAGDERFARSDDVKRAVVRHPATPRAISMHLVKFLHWRDLAAIVGDTELASALRTQAEQVLAGRLNQIPSAEKANLARTGGRAVLTALLHSRDMRVIPELLRNPRIAERDVVTLAQDRSTPSTVLGVVARDERWSRRGPVRLALVENHSTPLANAVRLLPGLAAVHLRAIHNNRRLPAPLRAEAIKLLRGPQKGC